MAIVNPRAGDGGQVKLRLVLALVVAVALLAFVSVFGLSRLAFLSPDAPIMVVYVKPGSSVLEVSVGTCNQNPQVTAVETATEVRLSSNEKVPRGASNDCADADRVTLEEPLGDRIVIDDATGDPVEVLPGETCHENPSQPDC